jgi:hypothetical protein
MQSVFGTAEAVPLSKTNYFSSAKAASGAEVFDMEPQG